MTTTRSKPRKRAPGAGRKPGREYPERVVVLLTAEQLEQCHAARGDQPLSTWAREALVRACEEELAPRRRA